MVSLAGLHQICRIEQSFSLPQRCRGDQICSSVAACPNGWDHFETSCYKLVREQRTVFAAKILCGNEGGHLVDIHSVLENDFVDGLIPADIPQVYLGYERVDENGSFFWDHTSRPGPFSNWMSGQPEVDPCSWKHCTVMDRNSPAEWLSVSCFNFSSFMCERPSTDECPVPFKLLFWCCAKFYF